MSTRSGFNDRSNDELARLLYQRESRKQGAPKPAKDTASPPALASRRDPYGAGNQSWSLGPAGSDSQPVNERERRALFAALSSGCKANCGREPTVAELLRLVEKVDAAREVTKLARDAIDGGLSVYFEDGEPVFGVSSIPTPGPGHESSDAA